MTSDEKAAEKYARANYDIEGDRKLASIDFLAGCHHVRQGQRALSSISEYLTAIGSLNSNPFKAARRVISFRQKRQVRPTATIDPSLIIPTIEAIPLDSKGIRDRAMLAILFGCGLRRSELAALKMGYIKLSRQILKTLYAVISSHPQSLRQ